MWVQDRFKDFVSDQREFFDALISEDWHTYYSPDWDEARRYEVAALFQHVRPATILDIGCGCGFHDREMAKLPFVESVTAIDYSPKSIEAANIYYPHPKVSRFVADLRELEGKNFDLVVSWQVFEHLDNPHAYYKSASRLLPPGGKLAIFTPNRLRLSNFLRILKRQPIQYCDPQHFKEYVPDELFAMGKDHGFEALKCFSYNLSGTSLINRLSMRTKIKLGSLLPKIADAFCVIMKKS